MWLHGCLINRVKFFHIIFSAIRNLLQAHNVSSLIICSAYDIRKQTVFSFAIARRHQIIQHFILPMYVFISKFRVRLDSFNLDHSEFPIRHQLVERPFSNLTADTCKLNNVQNTGTIIPNRRTRTVDWLLVKADALSTDKCTHRVWSKTGWQLTHHSIMSLITIMIFLVNSMLFYEQAESWLDD